MPIAMSCCFGSLVEAGELASLIGVEDFRFTEFGERFFDSGDAEVGLQRDRKPPGEHAARIPIHDRRRIDKPARHRDIRDVPIAQTWCARSTGNARSRYG